MHESIAPRLRLWAQVIREGLIMLFPLTMVGAACQGLLIPYAPYQAWMDTHLSQWDIILQLVYNATIGIMGLFTAIAISGCLLRRLNGDSLRGNELTTLSTAIVASSAFLIMVVPYSTHFGPEILGYGHLFEGVFAGLATAEILNLFFQNGIWRHTKSLVLSDALQISLKMTAVCGLTLGFLGLAGYCIEVIQVQVVNLLFLSEHWAIANSWTRLLPFNIILVTFNQMLWVLGLNGGQVLLSMSNLSSNADPNLLSPVTTESLTLVNAFAHLGGAGATWGLVLAILIKGKDPVLQRLAQLSLLPAVINVNEPLLLGVPLIFHRAWLFPFIAAPIINCLITFAVMSVAGVEITSGMVIWSTPIFLSGYLLTDSWAGPFAQFLGLIASTSIYMPFMYQEEQRRRQSFKELFQQSIPFLSAPSVIIDAHLERGDQHGEVARNLIQDFRFDFKTPRVYLAYQPIHDQYDRFIAVEALLRWKHAEYGNVAPSLIINLAEECDLINDIGEWAIRQASKDLCLWRRAGHSGFKVAINVSPIQLGSERLPVVVESVLEKWKLETSALGLEITESRALASIKDSEHTLKRLQEIGIAISMDDFGMGCTSLLYMQRFSLHSIKLDGSLTKSIQISPVNQDIIRTITRLGRARDVKVVAEFVQSKEQRNLLIELGCDLFQGHLYSPAVSSNELLDYLNGYQ